MKDRYVYCDVLQLSQILFNLLSNAVKFSEEERTISVSVYQEKSQIQGKVAYEMRVKDNGIGMSKEFQQHMFEAFERERTSTISGMQGMVWDLPSRKAWLI